MSVSGVGKLGSRHYSFDQVFAIIVGSAALSAVVLLAIIAGYLVTQSLPLWAVQSPMSFLTNPSWISGIQQTDGTVIELYGAASALFGTVVTSLIAIMFAAPIGIFAAAYLVEFAPKRLAITITFVVELIAAIPSVVFGLWAIGDLSGRLRDSVEWWITSTLGQIVPWLSERPGSPPTDNVFRAGFLLAVMILPMVVAVSREFLRSVPISLREGYIGMGATKWETLRHVIIPTARTGLLGAVLLALGRALGETIAVTMVIGNAPGIPSSLFLSGTAIAPQIANDFGEMRSIEHRAALVALGLTLFVLTFVLSAVIRFVLKRQALAKVAL